MGDKSNIEWTDATWNPVRGCSRVSEGCRHCYAETVAARFSDPGAPYHGFADRSRSGSKWTGHVALVEHQLALPLRWAKPRRIFVNSMSDLFHEDLPDEAIDRVFAVMALAPQHTFQVLTKRAERMRRYVNALIHGDRGVIQHACEMADAGTVHRAFDRFRNVEEHRPIWRAMPNVWLGVSVEDQERADERIPHLLAAPAAVRFLSCEPLLGPVDLENIRDPNCFPGCLRKDVLNGREYHEDDDNQWTVGRRIDWVIAGGESGPGARPMHPDWARSLRDQCAAAGVAFFFKQWGEWGPCEYGEITPGPWDQHHDHGLPVHEFPPLGRGESVFRVGKKAAGRLLDGVEHNATPEVSRG